MYKKSESSSGKPRSKSGPEGFGGKDKGGKGKPFQYKGDGKPGDKPFKRNTTSFGKSESADGRKPSFRKSDTNEPFKRNADKPFTPRGASDKPYDRKPRPTGDRHEPWDDSKSGKPTFEKTDGPKPFPKRDGPRPFPKKDGGDFKKDGADRPYKKSSDSKPGGRPGKYDKDGGKPSFKEKREFKPYQKDTKEGIKPRIEDKKFTPKSDITLNKVFIKDTDRERTPKKRTEKSDEKRPFKRPDGKPAPFERRKLKPAGEIPEPVEPKKKRRRDEEEEEEEVVMKEEEMPLNKYIAHCGVCSRRDAVELVKEGKVKVNGQLITDPGHKIMPDDVVMLGDKKLTVQKGLVYILLNKPKDYITTNDDPQGRRTVMDLLVGADAERLFPVGRLDRNTTGLLLITNDGDLTQKLAHPSYKVKKIYQATLDKPLTKADSEKIINGVTLEDGVAHVDTLAYLESKNELGLEIHSGRNRIVRRIFEHLGYEVVKLDRVMYGGLTKKNLPRGKWRYLNEREIVLLKHFKS
jgi:23S rRNA pseudouridine2605 synthase